METESGAKLCHPADRTSRRGIPGFLRVTAFIAMVVGAFGSVGLTFWAGRRNGSIILHGLFTLWVLSPFAALALANTISRRWSVVGRVTLYSVMLAITLVSLAIYGYVALEPARAKTAFVFVVVPPLSWFIITLAVALAELESRRRR
jgi:membrane-associated HD superfamily phosphohydrolase